MKSDSSKLALLDQIRELEKKVYEMEQEKNCFLFDRAVMALLGSREAEQLAAEHYLNHNGIKFHGNRFVLCAFSDHFSEPGVRDEGAVWESLNSTFYSKLSRIIRMEFRSFPAFATANFNGCIIGLCNLPDDIPNEAYLDILREICTIINNRVSDAEGFRFQVFASSIGFGLSSLSALRNEIDAMRDYWEIIGSTLPEFISYHDVAHVTPDERRIAASREANEQFSDYINRGDFEKAKKFFRERILGDRSSSHYSATTIRFRIAGMLDYAVQTLDRASHELGVDEIFDELNAAEMLLSANTLDEIAQRMDDILDALQCHWQSGSPSAQSLAQQARAFIDDNYADCNLNVNLVADHLGCSASHITRVFRSCYQMRVLDYIQQTRIRAAKQLLGTGLTLREIAEQSGYGTQINLIRAFKRIEGATPSQLRKELE